MSTVKEVMHQLFDKGTITLPKLGREVIIKKVTLRTMKGVTDLIVAAIEGVRQPGFTTTVDLGDVTTILKLISNNFEAVVDVASSLSSVDKDDLLDMEADESVLVLQAILLLNKDFFTRKVLPILEELKEEQITPPAVEDQTEAVKT